MFLTALLGFEQSVTGTADEVFVIRVNCLVQLQILRSEETHRTFVTNIRCHIFMYWQVILQLTLLNKLLRTDVTREPSAHVVGLQQMPLALARSLKTARAVPARELLRARVHRNMKPQAAFGLKSCSTVATVMRPYVVVYVAFMLPHPGRFDESSVAHRTLVRFVSRVDSQVPRQKVRLPERLVANGTFVRLLAAVNSSVQS